MSNRYGEHDEKGLEKLVGSKISKVQMNEKYLIFTTDKGVFAYTVKGDCCSHSYFYDFYGVKRLLENGEVLNVGTIDLQADDWTTTDNHVVIVYGFRLITKDDYYGEVSSVFSFRNDSNGYYGGMMYPADSYPEDVPEITKDTLL